MTTLVDDARLSNMPPERTIEQRMTALDKANTIRLGRAQVKRDVRARIRRPVDVLLCPPDCALSMPVFELLLAIPRWGSVKALRVLNAHRISTVKTIGGLSDRQRRELGEVLRKW